jgi:hypothetical protein
MLKQVAQIVTVVLQAVNQSTAGIRLSYLSNELRVLPLANPSVNCNEQQIADLFK